MKFILTTRYCGTEVAAILGEERVEGVGEGERGGDGDLGGEGSPELYACIDLLEMVVGDQPTKLGSQFQITLTKLMSEPATRSLN